MSGVGVIAEAIRTARKVHHCGMCGRQIKVGEKHSASTNVYDGRVYTWRECMACDRDGICNYAHDWSGGYHDEGVNYEVAQEWAEEAVEWPRNWHWRGRSVPPRSITTTERLAARNWLARAAGESDE